MHVGGDDRLDDDDGGHLIGTQFMGSGDIDNLLPQNRKVNRSGGEWYNMEAEWRKALQGKEPYHKNPPNQVEVSIKIVYPKETARPVKYKVIYQIKDKDNQVIEKANNPILNKAKE